jgi:hypothetical protein
MGEYIFNSSSRFDKQYKGFCGKHPEFAKSLKQLKTLLTKHFDSTVNFKFPPGVLCVDKNVKYHTVYKIKKVATKGLRKNQTPRIWFKMVENKVIFLLFMDSHLTNYQESQAVATVEQILKELSL